MWHCGSFISLFLLSLSLSSSLHSTVPAALKDKGKITNSCAYKNTFVLGYVEVSLHFSCVTFSSPNCFTSSPTLLYQYNICFSCMYCVLLQLFFVTHSSVSSCTNTNCIGLHSGGPQKLHQWSNVSLRVSTMISITIHLLCMRFLQMKLGLQLYAGLDEIIYRVNM